jgi:hypothetical protein
MNILQTLNSKYPTAEWVLTGSSYDGLEWLDKSPKPSEKQLQDLWLVVQAEEQSKVNAKASAITKLAALGLTLDEVEAAFGLTE